MTGSHDKFMMLADIQGHVQRTWKASHVHDLAISKDGRLLFCVTSEKKVVQSISTNISRSICLTYPDQNMNCLLWSVSV